MAIICSPDAQNWTHHFKLSGYDENWQSFDIGLTAIGSNGLPDVTAIRRVPYPKTTVRSNSGDGEFSVLRPPYGEFTRSDWSGGIGSVSGDDDATKYYCGERVWSVVPKQLTLAPNLYRGQLLFPTYEANDPELTWGTRFYKLTAGDVLAWNATVAFDTVSYEVLIRAYEPGTITFTLRADGAEPGAITDTSTTSEVRLGSHWYQFEVSKSAATYWIAVSANIDIEVGHASWRDYTTMVYDASEAAWVELTGIDPAFRMHSATKASDWTFFRYKGAHYVVSGQRLFMNGDRGACDDNTGHLDQLIDASKSSTWTTAHLWKDAVVHILGTDMWRNITDSDSTTLTVSPDWDRPLTTADNYVILGNERWTEITGTGVPGFTADVKDVCVSADGVVYFAQGGTVQLRRMREYNNAGTWTRDWASESTSGTYCGADFLCAALDQEDGAVMWRAVNGDNGSVSKAKSVAWGTGLSWGTAVKLGSDSGSAITGMCDCGGEVAVTKQEGFYFVKNNIVTKGTVDFSQQFTWQTGRRPCLVTPFLVIPYGNRIQRYYNEVCESFGPEMNGSLPMEYEGEVMDSKPLLADCVMVKDGGDAANYYKGAGGGAFLYRSGGWHPLAFTGKSNRMKACWYARVDSGMDALWVGDSHGLYFLTMPRGYDYTREPKFDSTKRLAPDGWMITGWFDTGRLQVDKWWDFITLYANNTTNTEVKVYYQVSNGDETESANLATDWYYAGSAGGSGTRTAGNYATRIGINSNGRRIRFLFLLVGDCTDTPVIEGYSVSYLSKDDDAVSWNFMCRMGDISYNLAGTPNDYTEGKTARDLIEYLARTVTPVTMRSIVEEWDNITVTLQRPLEVVAELTPEGKEALYLNMTILSVEEPTEPPMPLVWCERGGYHTYFEVTADKNPFTPPAATGDDVATFTYDCTLRAQTVPAAYRSKFILYAKMEEDTTGTAGEVQTITINNPGSGYTVNDEITLVQSGGAGGVVRVDSVKATTPGDPASGAILTYTLKDGGAGYEPGTGIPTTGGTGSDATFDILTVDNSWIAVSDTSYLSVVGKAKTGSDATATVNSFVEQTIMATWPGGVDPLDIESVIVTLAATMGGTRRRLTMVGPTTDAYIADACPYL